MTAPAESGRGRETSLRVPLPGGSAVAVAVRRRKGARHLRLAVNHRNEPVASAPWHCPAAEIARFLRGHGGWLERQLAKTPPTQTLADWLQTHPWLTGSGDRFFVRVETADRARGSYRFANGGAEIVLRLPAASDRTDAEAALRAVVRGFARDALGCRVAYQARRLELSWRRLTVRDQHGRWGSCSSSGSVSLNWRLVLLPPELQDYVILHELAHLREMNHSGRFWALLDAYDPDRRAHEAALDKRTAELMRVAR